MRHTLLVEFPRTFANGFKPEDHGLPYLQAIRFYGDAGVHHAARRAWAQALCGPHADDAGEALIPAENDTLDRLRRGELWGYARRETAARPFQRIEPHEWEGIPKREAGGVLRVGGSQLRQLHVHDPDGMPFEDALIAFGPAEIAREFEIIIFQNEGKFVKKDIKHNLKQILLEHLLSKLCSNYLISTGVYVFIIPNPQKFPYLPPPNVGFMFDDDGSRRAEHNARHLAEYSAPRYNNVHGNRIDVASDFWRSGIFEPDEKRLLADGRILGEFLIRLPPIPPISTETQQISGSPKRGGGRPPKYDWTKLHIHLGAKLAAKGLPKEGEQARLEEWVADQFPLDQTPSESEIRKHVTAAIAAHKAAYGKAGN